MMMAGATVRWRFMRTLARTAAIPAVAALAAITLLAGCGKDTATAGDPATTTAAVVTAAAPTTPSTAAPAPTEAPPTTGQEAPADGGVAEITVMVGVDDSPTRVEQVRLGQEVVILLQSDQDEEYHLHGFDIDQKAAAGTEAELTFTADKAGRFELESHTSDKVLLVLDVVA